ncbi:MAG: hypothetical protein OEY79_02415, partial [Anaplasmataceae bacterium]|nr:hypothetical protein [Anaplasmataceae bacterium]
MNNHINNINITYDLEGTKFSANRLVFNNYEIENIDSDSYTKVSDINSVIDNYRNNKGIDDPNSMYVLNDAQHNTNYIELKYNMYDVEFAANEIILDNHDIH